MGKDRENIFRSVVKLETRKLVLVFFSHALRKTCK